MNISDLTTDEQIETLKAQCGSAGDVDAVTLWTVAQGFGWLSVIDEDVWVLADLGTEIRGWVVKGPNATSFVFVCAVDAEKIGPPLHHDGLMDVAKEQAHEECVNMLSAAAACNDL